MQGLDGKALNGRPGANHSFPRLFPGLGLARALSLLSIYQVKVIPLEMPIY